MKTGRSLSIAMTPWCRWMGCEASNNVSRATVDSIDLYCDTLNFAINGTGRLRDNVTNLISQNTIDYGNLTTCAIQDISFIEGSYYAIYNVKTYNSDIPPFNCWNL